jgi:outer membrane lipoprotein-sorting protein
MKSILLFLIILVNAGWTLTAEEIVGRIDGNRVFNSIKYTAAMLIATGGQKREKSFEGCASGDDQAYMEFTAPERDRGTRFLKINDEMYIYIPDVGKPTRIAGHMLRQSMMGSDFSYDDFTENERLTDLYEIALSGSDTFNEKECHILELTAKVEEVTYFIRRMWVTKDTYMPVKTELYARSGKLMKEFNVLETRRIGPRDFPVRMRMVNRLRKDTYTELVFDKIELDTPIPDKYFSIGYLERK